MWGRDIHSSGAAFHRRADWYWHLDHELRDKTRFFGAAALTNRVLARLFEHHPNAVSKASGRMLMGLGTELEHFNRSLADDVRDGARAGPALDHQLVQAEQGVAQVKWQAHPCARVRPVVERELNGLLNDSHLTCLFARFWKDSRDYFGVLSTLRARKRAPLNFALESHRVDIGCALIEHLYRNPKPLIAMPKGSYR